MKARHIPNLICVMRMLLVGPVVWLLWNGEYVTTLVLFFVAGLSDGLDGYLAKRFDWRSRLGGILDPLADKLLLVSVFLTLTFMGMIPLWLTLLVVARDIVIVVGGTLYQSWIGPVEPKPTAISKLNTATQLLLVLIVVSRAGLGWPAQGWETALGAGVMVTTIVSGLDYVWIWGRRAMIGRQDAKT